MKGLALITMPVSIRFSGLCLLLAGLLTGSTAFATNGYFPHGTGAKNKAMAGAGMAMPQDAISIVNNPAVAAFLENRMDVGVSVFMPNRNYSTFFGGNNGQNESTLHCRVQSQARQWPGVKLCLHVFRGRVYYLL